MSGSRITALALAAVMAGSAVASLTSASAAALPVTAAPIQFWDASYVVELPETCDRPGQGNGKGHDKPRDPGNGQANGHPHDCDDDGPQPGGQTPPTGNP